MRKHKQLAELYRALAIRNDMLSSTKTIVETVDIGEHTTLRNGFNMVANDLEAIDALIQEIKVLESSGMTELKTPEWSTVGISYDKSRDQWMFRAKRNGKRTTIGRYDTQEEAVAAKAAFDDEQYQDDEE